MDIENLCFKLINKLNEMDKNILKNRYELSDECFEDTLFIMDEIGRRRGAILKKMK